MEPWQHPVFSLRSGSDGPSGPRITCLTLRSSSSPSFPIVFTPSLIHSFVRSSTVHSLMCFGVSFQNPTEISDKPFDPSELHLLWALRHSCTSLDGRDGWWRCCMKIQAKLLVNNECLINSRCLLSYSILLQNTLSALCWILWLWSP